jgi:hypothetical protein
MDEIIKKLEAEFKALYPNIRELLANRYATKYATEVIRELRYSEIRREFHSRDPESAKVEWLWPANEMKERIGRIKFGSKPEWIYSLFQKQPTLRLVEVVRQGSSFTGLSEILIAHKYRKLVMEQLRNYHELQAISESHKLTDYNYLVPVNTETLNEYLLATEQARKRNHGNDALQDKLRQNLKMGYWIRGALLNDENGSYLPEFRTKSESGREHATGINTQTVSKELRHAILGRCHEYDLRAGSFAILTAFATEINSAIKHETIRQYIQNREYFREKMAAMLNIPVKTAKRIFTAIGFGANVVANPYTTIGQILSSEQITTLRAWHFWEQLNDEFKEVKSQCQWAIDVATGELEIGEARYSPLIDGVEKRPAQKLAWLYQALESHYMKQVRRMIPDECVVLTEVHDCIYTHHRIPAETLRDIKVMLSDQTGGLLAIDHQARHSIHRPEIDPFQEQIEEEAAHRERIRQQEQNALGYQPLFATIDQTTNPKTDLSWLLKDYFDFQDAAARDGG